MKPCSKTRSDKSTCANIFLEPTLTNAGIILEWMHHHAIDHLQFWHSHRSGIHKHPPEVFLKFCKFHRKRPVLESLIYKNASLQDCNFTKKRPLHRCFPVKFEKFWRTPILKNIWTTASVYWLLHHILIFTILYSTRFTFLQITSSLLRN